MGTHDDRSVQMTPRLDDLMRFGLVSVPLVGTAYILFHEVALSGVRATSTRILGGVAAGFVFGGLVLVMYRFVRRDPSYRMASFHYNLTAYVVANALLAVYVAVGDPVWQNLVGHVTGWGLGLALHYVGFRFSVANGLSKEQLFS